MAARGHGVRFRLTAGQSHDVTQGLVLIEGVACVFVIADKGYGSDAFVAQISTQSAHVVIPSRAKRKTPREYDQQLYKDRYLVECFINKLKHYRHVFSRFEKLSRNYLSFVYLVSSIIWLH